MSAHRISWVLLLTMATVAAAGADSASHSLAPLLAGEWTPAHAAHLLRRAGFGGTPEEVDRLFKLGLDAAVASLVDYEKTAYDPAPPLLDPLILQPVDREEIRQMNPEERERYQEQRRRAERRSFEETRLWWIERIVQSPRPFRLASADGRTSQPDFASAGGFHPLG